MSAEARDLTVIDSEQHAYDATLRKLSEASVHRRFEAYKDIDWDSPDFAVSDDDERWILPEVDPLGAHPWYKAQPKAKQIAMGKYRYAAIMKVGLVFEQTLVGGLTMRAMHLPNNSPEFRYMTHEMIEEFNHILMFQEAVNRAAPEVDTKEYTGWRGLLLESVPLITLMGRVWPELMLLGILAGEEPIDFTQKQLLRDNPDVHPMIKRTMQIHVAEEARHISYAHMYLKRFAPKQFFAKRWALSLLLPVIMRGMAEAILIPPPPFFEKFDVPKDVRKDIWWDSAAQRQALAEMFGDVRGLAEESGMVNPVSRRLWKLMGIDAEPTRFRSEPARKPAASSAA